MKELVPLMQTCCWIFLILAVAFLLRKEISVLRNVVLNRLQEGGTVEIGPLKLGELKKEINLVRQEIDEINNSVALLFLNAMSPLMYTNLQKIASGNFGEYEMSIPFRQELHYMRMIGYIDVDKIMNIPNAGKNLSDHVKITKIGEEYIKLRKKLAGHSERMPYGTFATYEDVASKFKIKLIEQSFVQKIPFALDKGLFGFIGDNLRTRRSYVSENAICESIIFPILNIVAKNNGLPVWSHVRFDIAEEDGLVGVPDFIIAPASDIGTTFKNPVVCIAEAKKENFNEGWAQVLAEMIAAQKFNNNIEQNIFGIVTTGNFWQFGKLHRNILTMEIASCSAVENLQHLLDMLNWIVIEAKKNISQ